MKKIVKLTESDLANMVKRVMNESVVFDELKGYYSKCYRQSPTPTSNRIADEIYDSIDYQTPTRAAGKIQLVMSLGTSGIRTDEGKLIGAFKKLKSFDEFCSTKSSYSRIYHSDMLNDIDGDVDEDEIWKQLSRTVRDLYDRRPSRDVSGRIVKESLSNRTGDLYSAINEIIDSEFDDLEPSEIVRVLSNITKHHEGMSYRKKHNINPISKDEVLRNFKRF